jgi:hypothetical protein
MSVASRAGPRARRDIEKLGSSSGSGGLANGELWQSCDRGDTQTAVRLDGDPLRVIVALDQGAT